MATTTPTPEMSAESQQSSAYAVVIVGTTLSTIAVALRLFTRLRLVRLTGIDDWTILIAQVIAVGAGAAIALETHYGMGKHVWTLTPENFVRYLKCFYSSIVIYNGALTMVKVSIILQYRRIFAVPSMQRATAIWLAVICIWGFTNIMMLSMLCVPIQALWDKAVHGHCLPLLPVTFAPAAINIATDFGTWVLPLPVIKSLQLPKRQKIILMLIFGLGFFTCIISLVRLSKLKKATHTMDPTWDNTEAAMWSYLELSMAILAACLPTLRPLATKLAPSFLHSSSHDAQASKGYYVRQGEGHSTWVSSKLANKGRGPGKRMDNESTSMEALHDDVDYKMQILPEPKITVEREFIVDSTNAR